MSAIQGRDYARIYVKDSTGAARRSRSPRRSRRRSTGPWPSEMEEALEVRPYRSEDEALLFGLARLDRGADMLTLDLLEHDTVFVAEVGGVPATSRFAATVRPPASSSSS